MCAAATGQNQAAVLQIIGSRQDMQAPQHISPLACCQTWHQETCSKQPRLYLITCCYKEYRELHVKPN